MDRMDRLLTAQELAGYLDVPVATLYVWRYRREGPPGFRVGRHLRYRQSDIEEWIEHQLHTVGRRARDSPNRGVPTLQAKPAKGPMSDQASLSES